MKTKLPQVEFNLFILFIFIGLKSCLSIVNHESKVDIINISLDTTLKDSSMVYGMVILTETNNMPLPEASVWLEETSYKTTSDILGQFSLIVPSGTYTLNCLLESQDEKFTAVLKDIQLSPNEKTELLIQHGYMEE